MLHSDFYSLLIIDLWDGDIKILPLLLHLGAVSFAFTSVKFHGLALLDNSGSFIFCFGLYNHFTYLFISSGAFSSI